MSEQYLTTGDLAKTLKTSSQTIRRWINAGIIPAIVCGRTVRVSQKAFEQFQRNHFTGGLKAS
jgi:excisionase family DNA binding protein